LFSAWIVCPPFILIRNPITPDYKDKMPTLQHIRCREREREREREDGSIRLYFLRRQTKHLQQLKQVMRSLVTVSL